MFENFKKNIASYFKNFGNKNKASSTQVIPHKEAFDDSDYEILYNLLIQSDGCKLPLAPDSPLKPFWVPFINQYCDEEFSTYLVEQFFTESRPFTPENYKNIFYEHISHKNFFNRNKAFILHKLWKDAKYINDVLNPLEKIGIRYTLDLTGGSVRDFVLNKHELIKDLDFMISLQGDIVNYLVKENFSPDQLESVKWEEAGDRIDAKKSKLVQLCFMLQEEKLTVYDHTSTRATKLGTNRYHEDVFKYDRLIAVMKTDGSKTNYPIDILLTDFTKPKFVGDFNFDICKASFCFVSPHVSKKFPTHYTHLISRFVAEREFWADVYNKTITYCVTGRSQYHMENSFDDHLVRIQKKYPEYRVLVTGDNKNKSYLEQRILDDILPVKEEVVSRKKMKV